MILVNDTFDNRLEDLNGSKIKSLKHSEKRSEFGGSSKLNRPFKSPLLKTLCDHKVEKGTSPITSRVPSQIKPSPRENKRNSTFRSPVCSKNQPKRLRLSTHLKEINIEDLLEKESKLDQEIVQLQQEGLSVEELDLQIDLLHRYNDIKDIAQIVMGRLAELEGVTVKSLHQKYNAPLCD